MAKKRGSVEGTIFQRKDGRWSSSIDLGWENDKRKRKTFYGATQKEVRDALNNAVHDRAQGLPVALERQTLEQFLKHWLAESVRPSVRPLTHEQYEQHVRLYINPAIGKVQNPTVSATGTVTHQSRAEGRVEPQYRSDNAFRSSESFGPSS